MSKRVLILDTSVLCCFLRVPNKETAGPADDRWDYARAADLVDREKRLETTFVLPLATIIETGNHIAQAPTHRHECATRLAELIASAADAVSPWAPFTDQADLWSPTRLQLLAATWPDLAAREIAIGDATIADVAEYYAAVGYSVEIVTGDGGLREYHSAAPVLLPRRRTR